MNTEAIQKIVTNVTKILTSFPAGVPYAGPIYTQYLAKLSTEELITLLNELKGLSYDQYDALSSELQNIWQTNREQIEKLKELLEAMIQKQQTTGHAGAASLKIQFDPGNRRMLGPIRFPDGSRRKFACVKVVRVQGQSGQRCWGTLKLLRWPPLCKPIQTEFNLHWADTGYTMQSDVAEPVDIHTWNHLDIVFSLPPGWPDKAQAATNDPAITSSPVYTETVKAVDFTESPLTSEFIGPGTAPTRLPSTTEEPVATPPVSGPDERYRMETVYPSDLAKAHSRTFETPKRGCWVAIPLALNRPDLATQAYLPPGDYQVKVQVGCDSGTGDLGCFKLRSPEFWLDLDFEADSCPEPEST